MDFGSQFPRGSTEPSTNRVLGNPTPSGTRYTHGTLYRNAGKHIYINTQILKTKQKKLVFSKEISNHRYILLVNTKIPS